jgi:hypothetical protein
VTSWQIILAIALGVIGIGFAIMVLSVFVFLSGITGDPIEHIDE